MNRKEQKLLNKVIKSLPDENIEDVVEYPQIIQSFFTDMGVEPPNLEDIRIALNKEINKRLKKIIIKEVVGVFKNRKKADD